MMVSNTRVEVESFEVSSSRKNTGKAYVGIMEGGRIQVSTYDPWGIIWYFNSYSSRTAALLGYILHWNLQLPSPLTFLFYLWNLQIITYLVEDYGTANLISITDHLSNGDNKICIIWQGTNQYDLILYNIGEHRMSSTPHGFRNKEETLAWYKKLHKKGWPSPQELRVRLMLFQPEHILNEYRHLPA